MANLTSDVIKAMMENLDFGKSVSWPKRDSQLLDLFPMSRSERVAPLGSYGGKLENHTVQIKRGLMNTPLAGYNVMVHNMTKKVPNFRSPSRAKRRAAKGHPQCYKEVPDDDNILVSGSDMFLTRVAYQRLVKAIQDDIDRKTLGLITGADQPSRE